MLIIATSKVDASVWPRYPMTESRGWGLKGMLDFLQMVETSVSGSGTRFREG